MQTLGVLQGSVWCRWLDQGFGKTPLILSGQAQDGLLLNGALGGIMGGADDKIREAAPLQFRRPLQRGIDACRKACFEA
jgi:hypothetical protein